MCITSILNWFIVIHAPLRERLSAHRRLFCYKVFQSTLPHGSDRLYATTGRRDCNFNPRSLTGATNRIAELERQLLISIHAPSRGRRKNLMVKGDGTIISIHAPSRERPLLLASCSRFIRFQSTLPCGSDQTTANTLATRHIFQSTLPCGSDFADSDEVECYG